MLYQRDYLELLVKYGLESPDQLDATGAVRRDRGGGARSARARSARASCRQPWRGDIRPPEPLARRTTRPAAVGSPTVTLRTSPLDAAHRALGAKMVPFGGWDMPLALSGRARSPSTGPAAPPRWRSTSAISAPCGSTGPTRSTGCSGRSPTTSTKVGPGRAQYTHLLDEADASVLDDIIVWWVDDERFDVMPNASNTDRVRRGARGAERGRRHRRAGRDRRAGPDGPRAPAPRSSPDAAAVGRFHVAPLRLGRRRLRRRRHRLHRRGRRRVRGARRARAATFWERGARPPASTRPASAPATRCGSRPACRCTATSSARASPRCRPDSAGS